MKIHVTHAGKVWVIVAGCLFLIFGGSFIISELIKKHRIKPFAKINKTFTNSDISYHDWETLKTAFKEHQKMISNTIDTLKNLQKRYPNDKNIKTMISNYTSHLNSMDNAYFPCPEHITSVTQECPHCGGKGKSLMRTCKTCNGKGELRTDLSHCPYCGEKTPSQVPAKKLTKSRGSRDE